MGSFSRRLTQLCLSPAPPPSPRQASSTRSTTTLARTWCTTCSPRCAPFTPLPPAANPHAQRRLTLPSWGAAATARLPVAQWQASSLPLAVALPPCWQIPHYHLEKATEAVKPVMGEVRPLGYRGSRRPLCATIGGACKCAAAAVAVKVMQLSSPAAHAASRTRELLLPLSALPAAVLPRAGAQPRLVPHPPHRTPGPLLRVSTLSVACRLSHAPFMC